MHPETERTAKRAILGLLGSALCIPAVLAVLDAVSRPRRDGVVFLGIALGGSLVGPILLSHWDRWPTLKPGNRVGAFMITAYLIPPLILLLGRYEHVEDTAFLGAPWAMGLTSLWWSLWGYRLDGLPPGRHLPRA